MTASKRSRLTLGMTLHVVAVTLSACPLTVTGEPPTSSSGDMFFKFDQPKSSVQTAIDLESELKRAALALDIPAGINLFVDVQDDSVSWTVAIGSNKRGPARLLDLAQAVGMDDHERPRVLVAWSDKIAGQLCELTIATIKRVRPEHAFYPDTEFALTVHGHPIPSTLPKDDPRREAATRFERMYAGSDCVLYFNGEVGIDSKLPRNASLGTVTTRIAFDSPEWNLANSKRGTLVFTNDSPNRVRISPYPFITMTRNGQEIEFKRNGIICALPLRESLPQDLVLEPGSTGSLPIELVTSTPYGTYHLSAGELTVTLSDSCKAGVPVQTASTTVIAIGAVPPGNDE